MSQNENLLDVIALLYKWKKLILGASFLVAVIAAGASLLKPNFYKASTLFYSASSDLALPMPIGHESNKKFIYGTDNDLDRLFSISNSNALKGFLIEKFDLYNHYEVNQEDPLARHKLSLKLNKLYQTQKTKYDAISVNVEDTDPEFAARMANAAREKINGLAQKVIKDSYAKQIKSYEQGLSKKQSNFNHLMDSLGRVKAKYGIFSSDSQGEAYGSSIVDVEGKYLNASAMLEVLQSESNVPRDSIARASAKKIGLQKQLDKLKKDIVDFNNGYPIVKNLERITRDQSAQMNLDVTRLTVLKNAYESDFTAIHVIEKAEVPPYKSRPKRSILVVMSAVIMTLLMSLWVIIRDQYVKNDWKTTFQNR